MKRGGLLEGGRDTAVTNSHSMWYGSYGRRTGDRSGGRRRSSWRGSNGRRGGDASGRRRRSPWRGPHWTNTIPTSGPWCMATPEAEPTHGARGERPLDGATRNRRSGSHGRDETGLVGASIYSYTCGFHAQQPVVVLAQLAEEW